MVVLHTVTTLWHIDAAEQEASTPSTWLKMLMGLRRPRLRRLWVGAAGFRWCVAG